MCNCLILKIETSTDILLHKIWLEGRQSDYFLYCNEITFLHFRMWFKYTSSVKYAISELFDHMKSFLKDLSNCKKKLLGLLSELSVYCKQILQFLVIHWQLSFRVVCLINVNANVNMCLKFKCFNRNDV